MAATYEPIATSTISGQTNFAFTNIPQTYTDLRLVWVGTSSPSGEALILTLNTDTATNYSFTYLRGNGSAASSSRGSNEARLFLSASTGLSSTIPALATMDIFSYTSSNNKTCLISYNGDFNGSGNVENKVYLWRNSSPLTSIRFSDRGAGQTFTGTITLYGIKAA